MEPGTFFLYVTYLGIDKLNTFAMTRPIPFLVKRSTTIKELKEKIYIKSHSDGFHAPPEHMLLNPKGRRLHMKDDESVGDYFYNDGTVEVYLTQAWLNYELGLAPRPVPGGGGGGGAGTKPAE